MGRLIFFMLVFFSCVQLNAQDTIFRYDLKKTFPGNYSDFTVDELGNIIYVVNSMQLKKFGREGDSIGVYNDVKRYGNIHSVDASNPFKILVFYKTTATIVILDRLLGVKQVIDLRKNNILGAKAIKQSYDNNIWVFDELENKIKKIDDNGKLLSESADLRNVFAEAPSFEWIFDDNRSLYLYDEKQGWFVFDYYGAFKRKYAFTGWKDVQLLGDVMMGRDANKIFVAKTGGLDYSRFNSNISYAAVVKTLQVKKLRYVLYADRLEIYDAP